MPGYVTEYAKSGRSTCKGCNKTIDQGDLRIGKMVKSPHFDGEIPLWHHRKCLFKREVIIDSTLLNGLTNLRPEDQKSLKEEVAKNGGSGGGSSSSTSATPFVFSSAGDKFTVDYAKSGRSSCKHCNNKIDQDELRIGKMVKSPAFDGEVPNWHHLKCVFKACVIFSHACVDKLDTLRIEDQKELKKLIDQHSPNPTAPKHDADGDVEMKKEKSTKTKANKKKRKKGEDSDEDEEDDEDEKPSKKASKTSATDYSKMSVADLKAQCEEQGLTVKAKSKKADLIALLQEANGGDEEEDATPTKALSPADAEKAKHEKAIEEEGKQKWAIKDAIDSISNNEIKALLAANSQPNTGGRDKLMDALVDGLMYGALPACSECGHHALTFTDGQYACHGNASEWGRCVWKGPDVKRTKFDVSAYDGDLEYFASYKFKALKKPLEAHAYIANLHKKVTEQHQQLAAAAEEAIKAKQQQLIKDQVKEELFNEFVFVFVGTKFPKESAKELKKLVEAHGGEVSTDIEEADLIITTPEEVKANKNKKLKEAQAEKKPILLATFITDSIEKLELREPKDYSALDATAAADNWTDLKSKVESGRQKSGAKLASASGTPASTATKSGLGKSGSGKAKLIIKGRGAVDDDSGLAESGHILEERDDVWTQTLSVTDLTSGVNSYYILQLIESDTKDRYHVFRKWGRTGSDRGSHKLTDHGRAKEAAKQEFMEVYLDKTGNHWTHRKNFTKKPGKFNPVDVDYSGGDDPFDEPEATGESTSKLDPRIQDLIKIFFDVQQIKKTLMSMEIDLDKMPLGKLSRAHIQSGYSVLTEIQEAIKKDPPSESQLLALSNKFFTLIPHEGTPAILRNEEDIKGKIEMIETLLEIEVATRMLKEGKAKGEEKKEDSAAASSSTTKSLKEQIAESNDPIDIHYRQLKTDMVVVDQSSEDFKLISTYIKNTHAPTHTNYTLDLLEAFQVDRENEGNRYKSFEQDKNRMLLWHGSRTTNFVGILSQGLRIAPPEAPVTGYMFGKGVYFADMVSKSANYCFTNQSNNIGFLLLCEVALGDMNLLTHSQYMDKPPAGTLSTKGIGITAPDPKGFVTLPNGCVVPAGKPTKLVGSSSLLYNEFIVYDVAQIRMKYLLKVRFNYAQRW